MFFNLIDWVADKNVVKIHPTQKPVNVLKQLIRILTDIGDVVIDPVAGSGTTLRAATEINRKSYGFEIKKNYFKDAKDITLAQYHTELFI
jgi:site-specific DNA-methyltransferase (adenine-specific)